MLKEFRDFLMRGNVIDLAVGVIARRGIHGNRELTGQGHSSRRSSA